MNDETKIDADEESGLDAVDDSRIPSQARPDADNEADASDTTDTVGLADSLKHEAGSADDDAPKDEPTDKIGPESQEQEVYPTQDAANQETSLSPGPIRGTESPADFSNDVSLRSRTKRGPSIRMNYSFAIILIFSLPLGIATATHILSEEILRDENHLRVQKSSIYSSVQSQIEKSKVELRSAYEKNRESMMNLTRVHIEQDLEKLSLELTKQRRTAGLFTYRQNASEPMWTMDEIQTWATELSIALHPDRFLISKNGRTQSPEDANTENWIQQFLSVTTENSESSKSDTVMKSVTAVGVCHPKDGICLVENVRTPVPSQGLKRIEMLAEAALQRDINLAPSATIEQDKLRRNIQITLLLGAFLIGLLCAAILIRHLYRDLAKPLSALENRIRLFANGEKAQRETGLSRTQEITQCEDAVDSLHHLLASQKSLRQKRQRQKSDLQDLANQLGKFSAGELDARLILTGETEQQMLAHGMNRFLDALSAQIHLVRGHALVLQQARTDLLASISPSEEEQEHQDSLNQKIAGLKPLTHLLQEIGDRMDTLASALPDGHPVADELARLHKVLENRSQTAQNLFTDLVESVENASEQSGHDMQQTLEQWRGKIELLEMDLKTFGLEPSLEKFIVASKDLSDSQRTARMGILRPAA
jgi:methyl-accepting chemotaxis protein